MPKHTSDSQLEFPRAKKTRVSDSPNRVLVRMNMEKTKMSVREKLLAGVAIGLKKAQNQQQQQGPQQQAAHHNGQHFYEVATLQDSVDQEFHVNPDILQSMNSSSQSKIVIFPAKEEEKEEYQKSTPGGPGKFLLDQFCLRKDQRRHTSRRFQAVMGLVNNTPFVPTGVSQALAQYGSGEGLRLFLHSACRRYGYRKLEVNLLEFLYFNVSHDFRVEPLDSVPTPATEEIDLDASLGAQEGSLTIYESDVPDDLGHITTWLWLKICRPLESNEQSGHSLAPDTTEDQEAWNIVAIPKSQVEMMYDERLQRHAPSEMTNGDFITEDAAPDSAFQESKARLVSTFVAMRYSRDGIPSMACSDKKGEVYSAWFDFRPDLRDVQWDKIYDTMTINSCLVHAISKPGVGWVTVPPERPEQPKRSSGGGVRRSSRLKQEVHLED